MLSSCSCLFDHGFKFTVQCLLYTVLLLTLSHTPVLVLQTGAVRNLPQAGQVSVVSCCELTTAVSLLYSTVYSQDPPYFYPKEYVCTSREEMRGGWGVFTQIEPNWPLPYSTVPVPRFRDARPAGWVTYCSICASTLPRAQNRAEKGSILLWRQLALAILLLFIYVLPCLPDCMV